MLLLLLVTEEDVELGSFWCCNAKAAVSQQVCPAL